jgi:hypothetical protein
MVVAKDHPSTVGLPHRWKVQDEIYNFDRDPRDLDSIVVLTADESTYNDPGAREAGQGSPHPICKLVHYPRYLNLVFVWLCLITNLNLSVVPRKEQGHK